MKGIILYDNKKGRYIVEELINDALTNNSRIIDLHCGGCLSLYVKNGLLPVSKKIPIMMYLVGTLSGLVE